MSVTEAELAAILDHCRSLVDTAEEVHAILQARSSKATLARQRWQGPHALVFDGHMNDEAYDLAARARGLQIEADEWARVWADTVDKINRNRRETAVNEISSARGIAESFVDLFVGDDSGDQVRTYRAVPVPSAPNRYRATGGLETF